MGSGWLHRTAGVGTSMAQTREAELETLKKCLQAPTTGLKKVLEIAKNVMSSF